MKVFKLSFSLLLCLALFASPVFATEGQVQPNLEWIEGGTTVPVGDLSSLNVDESLLYLDKANTEALQQYFGNTLYGTELGSVFPVSDEEDWYVLFEYEEVGYISDKEKSKINAKKLLESYQEGTDAANAERPVEEQLYVKGWHKEPYYNDADNTLVWALLAEDYQGNQIINYNVRILTREGYVSTLLVTGVDTLEQDIKTLETLILPNYSLNEGSRYEDHDPATDKISELGLSGLILGGAGLVAAKKAGLLITLGLLLKKFWFVLIVIPVAIWNWLKRRKAGKKDVVEQGPIDSTTSNNTIDHDSK